LLTSNIKFLVEAKLHSVDIKTYRQKYGKSLKIFPKAIAPQMFREIPILGADCIHYQSDWISHKRLEAGCAININTSWRVVLVLCLTLMGIHGSCKLPRLAVLL